MHLQSTPFQLSLFDKRCALCGVMQPRAHFSAYAMHSDGLRRFCKAGEAARYQAFRARHAGPCATDGCVGRPSRQGLCATHDRAALQAGALKPPARTLEPVAVTALDLAWLAGVCDGEGTIFMSRMRPRDRARNPHDEAGASVVMTSESTVRAVSDAFGGNVCGREPYHPRHKRMWRWRVTPWKGVRFRRAMRPYLRLKGPQADLALAFMDLALGRHRGSPPLTEAELAQRAVMYEQMMSLNGDRFGRRWHGVRPLCADVLT